MTPTCKALRTPLAFVFTLLVAHGAALASPTAEEFLPCHKMAADMLQRCLDGRPGYENDACWAEAKTAQQRCYRSVNKAHRPDKARIEAERRAAAPGNL